MKNKQFRFGVCIPRGPVMRPTGTEEDEKKINVLINSNRCTIDAGFDYIEAGTAMIMALTDDEIDKLSQLKKEGKFNLEALNGFIPPTLSVTDSERKQELTEYVEKAMKRMNALDIHTVVFGSGKARSIPEGGLGQQAREEIIKFLNICNQIGSKYDVTVVIEPLNKKETNTITTVGEGAEIVKKLNLSNIKLLADTYHMFCENEPFDVIKKEVDILKHIHIAEAPDRTYPGKNGGEYLKAFAKVLKESGYCGRVSVEANLGDYDKGLILTKEFIDNNF